MWVSLTVLVLVSFGLIGALTAEIYYRADKKETHTKHKLKLIFFFLNILGLYPVKKREKKHMGLSFGLCNMKTRIEIHLTVLVYRCSRQNVFIHDKV